MWWTLIAVKGSWSYSDQQYMVLCLVPESSRAPDSHQLHGKLRKRNSYLPRLINATWRGVLIIGPHVVNSPFCSWRWIWGSASVWTRCLPWCMGETTWARSDPASSTAGPGAVGGVPAGQRVAPPGRGGLSPPPPAATGPGEPSCHIPFTGLQLSLRLRKQGDERYGLP